MSPPKRIPHFALSIVTAYPISYLSIYNPSLSDPSPHLPFLNRYLHISTDVHVRIPPFEMLSLPSLSISTLSTPPQHSHHVSNTWYHSSTKHNFPLHPTYSTKLLSCCLPLKTMFFSHLFSGFFPCLLPNPTQPQPTVQTRLPTTPTQRYHHLSKE